MLPLVLAPLVLTATATGTTVVTGTVVAVVVAPVAVPPLMEPTGDFVQQALTAAFQRHDWAMLAGILLTAAVYLLRQFEVVQRIPARYVPLFTGGLAMGGSFGVGIYTHQSAYAVLVTGLTVGILAVGAWEHAQLLRKPLPTPPPPLPPPPGLAPGPGLEVSP